MCKEREISKKGHHALNILSTIAFAIVGIGASIVAELFNRHFFIFVSCLKLYMSYIHAVLQLKLLFNTHRKNAHSLVLLGVIFLLMSFNTRRILY